MKPKMDHYLVTSHTDYDYDVFNEKNGERYQVLHEEHRWSCTCPHFIFRLRRSGGQCKHIELIRRRRLKYARQGKRVPRSSRKAS